MASELLNTFRKIEKGRLDCINSLNKLNYPLNKDSSFSDIATYLDQIPAYNNRLYNGLGDNYTPEDDPELYHRPSDWINIREILEACTDVTVDGSDFYPSEIYLFSTDLDTTTFYLDSTTTDTQAQLPEGNVKIGKYGTPSATYANQKYGKYLVFNDGGTALLNKSVSLDDLSATHTWDKSKDIVLLDGTHLKYMIVYQENSNGGINERCYYSNFTGVDLHECVATTHRALTYTNSNTPSGSGLVNKGIGGGKTYKKLTLISPFTPLGKNHYSITSFVTIGENTIEEIVIDFEQSYRLMSAISIQNKTLKIFRSNVPLIKSIPIVNTNEIISGLTLLEVPYLTQFSPNQSNYTLKYLYIDPEQQQQQTVSTIFGGSNLVDTNFFENIRMLSTTGSAGSTQLYGFQGTNMRTIEFKHLTSLPNYSLNNLQAETVVFNELTTLNSNPMSYSNIINLYMPKLEEVTAANWVPTSVRYLSLPSLKKLSQIQVVSKTAVTSLLYLDISGITDTSVTLNTDYSKNLIYVNFAEEISFTTLSLGNAPRLTRDCLLDIINKLADVTTDDVTHTLALSSHHKVKLTEDELKIATDKGWVV